MKFLELVSIYYWLGIVRNNRKYIQFYLTIPSVLSLFFVIIWFISENSSWEPWTAIPSAVIALVQIVLSVAENTVPKQVKDMSIEEIKSLIIHSSSSDWERVSTLSSKSYSYKMDANLRIEQSFNDSGLQNENFREEWANKFPDTKAIGLFFDIYFTNSLIARVVLVMVDGGRADLPLPYKREGRWLTDEFTYAIAHINDNSNSLKKYMQWAKISVDFSSSKL